MSRRAVLIVLASLVVSLAFLATTGDAQPPLRIGASLSQTGSFAALGQNQLRGYQILKMDLHTVFGAFKVDPDGFQIAPKMLLFQWQDGRNAIVWPEELAPGKPRVPTPPWSQRG